MSSIPQCKLIWVFLTVAILLAGRQQVHAQTTTSHSVHLEGELEVLTQDYKDHASVRYSLKLQDGNHVPLHFRKDPPTHLLTGTHIGVDGEHSDSGIILYSGSTSVNTTTTAASTSTTSSSILPGTLGSQSTLVMLVNFNDYAVQPYTVADAQSAYFGVVNNFIAENSYGQTSLTGDVVGWTTIAESVAACNMTAIATDAQNAAKAAGFNLANYTRYVYAFPQNNVCGWAGSSYVGGNPSQSWINGNGLDIHVIVHELGHSFGLWHSHLLDCGATATIGTACNVVEYGDPLDVMGVPQSASPQYNAFQKERLGWLNSGIAPAIQTVQSSGTYTINAYELGATGPNALKILKSVDPTTGAKTWYYLEARQAIGFDAFLADGVYYSQNETNGVLFHVGTDNNGNTGDLLDLTPQTSTNYGWLDASLAAGQTFQDPAAAVTFTTIQATPSGATIQVTVNATSPTPNLSVSTNKSSYSLGQSVGIVVTAFSGSAPDPGVGVSTNLIAPNGKVTTLKATTGPNGVASFVYKLSKRSPVGTYQVQALAAVSGASSTAGASTSFVVQ
jgi:M6 family metalloprotease-like protein